MSLSEGEERCEAVETPVVCACVGGSSLCSAASWDCAVFTLESGLIGGDAWAERGRDVGGADQRRRVFVRTNELILLKHTFLIGFRREGPSRGLHTQCKQFLTEKRTKLTIL